MARVVVVGAGVGGLAVAARLAALGHDVTVCEQAAEVGGKLGRRERDGFVFDTGPSLLTMPHVFRDLFAATGVPLDDVVDLRPVDPIAHYRFADGTELDAWTAQDRFAAELDERLAAGSGDDWRRLTQHAAAMWRAVEQPFLRAPLAGPRDLLRLSRRVRDLATIQPHRSLRDLGRRYLRDARLRTFLDRYATYTGSDPRRAPAALATVPYVEQRFGAWYVAGGLHRLAAAIRDRALERGARLRLGARVVRPRLAGGRVVGVELDGGEYLPADVVVDNSDAASGWWGPLPRRAQPSLSGFVLLLGVEGRTPGLAHHTVLFSADYDAEFDALFGPSPRPVPDPALYVAVPRDPATAPAGCESWFVLANAPRQGPVDWDAAGMAAGYAERLLDLLAARGLPVRGRVRFLEFRTPADLQRVTGARGGAIYGTSSNGPRAAFLRPANRTRVPNAFRVGGSSHPGGGLPLVTLSAEIVAGLVGAG